MAEPSQQGAPASASPTQAATLAPKKPQNPVFRMMGIPNLPKRLPSRNWMIFFTLVGSFAAAKTYDTRQKKRVQKKWCDLVGHIAQEKLPVNEMPRKLTVFISAAPGDSIGPTRIYFKEYIKPILVAASMDYDVIEGRKEGDVRYGTAEQIRRLRRKQGERGNSGIEPELDTQMAIDQIRDKLFIKSEPKVRGDLVLGRHTWKEYIRGIHEGWLGPLDEPPPPPKPMLELAVSTVVKTPAPTSEPAFDADTKVEKVEEKAEEKTEESKKRYPPDSYLPIPAYESAPLSPHIPQTFDPSEPLHQQHLLGFLKTPQRVYNYLNKRKLADDLGRQTAAIILAQSRPFGQDSSFASTSSVSEGGSSPTIATKAPESDVMVVQTGEAYEQQSVLEDEEPFWHKSIRKPLKEGDDRERVWLNEVAMDSRIAQRMRRFALDASEEERADRLMAGLEKSRAVPIHDLRQDKPIIGDLDE